MSVRWSLPLLAALSTQAIVPVDLTTAPGALFQPQGLGTAVPIWISPSRYDGWRDGFQRAGFQVFRFPNGTLSNEYHWNGKGSFDSAGLWTPSETEVGPGFTCRSKWRGTTKDNYDARLPSHLTDGDTSSMWWGETYQDSILPWAILDLGENKAFDSVEVLWGGLRPASVRIETWGGPAYPWPQHGDGVHWKLAAETKVKGARTGLVVKGGMGRHLALRPVDAPRGVQVREVRLWLKGELVSRNNGDPRGQTKVVAISAHPGSEGRAEPWIPDWTFDRYVQWLKTMPGAEGLICVNFGTGTAQEAAAWVRYANVVKKYGIKRWHVGNEVDGHWEEGGPVDPAQYAIRFAEFSRAMKAVDPTIEVYGPVTYSNEFQVRRSGRTDGMSWIESFLARVGAMERATKTRLLDGVDFHSYPYYFEQGPSNEDSMVAAIARFGASLDVLKGLMDKHLDEPATRKVVLSEFNSTVKVTALTLEQVNGLVLAMMFQDLWTRFPDRSLSILWEPMGGEPMNPDGSAVESYGSLRLFTPARGGLRSELPDPPTSSWWAQLLLRTWMGGPKSRVIPLPPAPGALRLSGMTDSDIWSVMATNPSALPETLAIRFPREAGRDGEVLSWTPEHYRWSDRTAEARAMPNIGPTSRPLAVAESLVVVPPKSILVVRRGRIAKAAPRLLHAAWMPGRLAPSDTLVLCASVAAEGRRVKGASWKVVARDVGRFADFRKPGHERKPEKGLPEGKIASFDGAFDGSHEAVLLRLPASDLPRGSGLLLEVRLEVDGAEAVTVPVVIPNEDVPRPVVALDHFDKDGLVAAHGQGWWTYGHGGNGTRMENAWEPTPEGGHFKGTFTIIQPPSQGWPNIALAGLNVGPKDYPGFEGFAGLVFDVRTRHSSAAGSFLLQGLTTTVTDHDDYQFPLPSTSGSWKRVWVRWEEMDQAGWGKDQGPFDPAKLRALQFRVGGEGTGTIEIENLSFWATSGEALKLADPPRPSRGPVRR